MNKTKQSVDKSFFEENVQHKNMQNSNTSINFFHEGDLPPVHVSPKKLVVGNETARSI